MDHVILNHGQVTWTTPELVPPSPNYHITPTGGLPSRHGGTLNSRQAASTLVRLVEGEERWEASDHLQDVLPQNWSESELTSSVTCMVLKATDNDRRHLALCHDEFRGP
ncbi:uncharacterized protein TNCV_457101 [Trichonephila clavipes]|nr:uncharacterized protein TNCV_457101 [Trichonephila clavipes]